MMLCDKKSLSFYSSLTLLLFVSFVDPAGSVAQTPDKAPAVSDVEAKVAEELFQDGRKLFFQGKHLEAIGKLKQAAATNPAKTSYKLLLAKAYRTAKQDAEAIKVFEAINKDNPEHVEAGIQLAELLTPQKEPARVIAVLQPLVRLKHTYSLYHLLAEAHYQKEDLNKARQYYEEAVKLNSRNRDDHYQLGNIYLAQKRFAKAAKSYETAAALGYSSGVFHFKLASVYFNLHNYLGKLTTAEVIGGKAGEISGDLYLLEPAPGKSDTFYALGPRSAVYQIAKAQKMGIDIFDIRFLEANTWLSAHHYAKADAVYKQLQEKVGKDDAGLFWSQWAQAALGQDDYDNFIARLKKAIEAQPDVYSATMSDALVTVARRYQQRGDSKRHLEFLHKAMESNPLSASFHLALGDAYWSASDKEKAIHEYKLVMELEPAFSARVRLLNRIRGQEDNAPLPTDSSSTSPSKLQIVGARCLLSGKPALPEFTTNYKGAKLFFCCERCKKEFAANLAKLSAKANHQLFLTGQAQATVCPLTGRKLNAKYNVQIAGVEVPFCCGSCKSTALKETGDAQIELVFNNVAFAKYFKITPAGSGD